MRILVTKEFREGENYKIVVKIDLYYNGYRGKEYYRLDCALIDLKDNQILKEYNDEVKPNKKAEIKLKESVEKFLSKARGHIEKLTVLDKVFD